MSSDSSKKEDPGAMLSVVTDRSNNVYEDLKLAAVDLANRSAPIVVAGRHMVWDGIRMTHVEVEPKQRPNLTATIADLADFVTAVERLGSDNVIVLVNSFAIKAYLDYESPNHRDAVHLGCHIDSLVDAGSFGLTDFVDQIERLMDVGEVRGGEGLLELLRMVIVTETKAADIQERGAHIKITSRAEQSVQGSRDGAAIDLPKVIEFYAPYGTRWRTALYRARLRVSVNNGALRFAVTHLNAEQMSRDWVDEARNYLQGTLDTSRCLVVAGQ